jgi:type VI protein secretion system component VasK
MKKSKNWWLGVLALVLLLMSHWQFTMKMEISTAHVRGQVWSRWVVVARVH